MLELIVEDSQCSAKEAVTAYRKLTDVDGVKVILGTSCSGAMLGVAPLAEADGVILFSGLASSPDIANAGDYIFRTQISDVEVGVATGNLMWADGVRRLATITEATDYAEGVRRTTVAQFTKLGGQVVSQETYASDVTDFRTPTEQTARRSTGCASPGAAVRVCGRSDHQAGARVRLSRPHLRRDSICGHDIVGDRRRRRHRDESDHGGPAP